MIDTQVTPAPTGMTVTFDGDATPAPVVALLVETIDVLKGQRRVHAVAVHNGALEIASEGATVAVADPTP